MSGKNTYWITGPDGTKALVEGADERDRWVRVHHWAISDEPQPGEFVYLANENPELGPARLTWQAAQDPAWEARGWAPGPPEEPENQVLTPERLAEHRSAQEKASAKAEKQTSKPAAGGKTQE